MAIFDRILKRGRSKGAEKPEKPSVLPTAPARSASVRDYAFGIGILAAPRITEKATHLTGFRQYVFRVSPTANKHEVRDAVAKRYGVRIKKVRMVRIPGKTKRFGRRMSVVPGYTKAVVTLREGESIDLE